MNSKNSHKLNWVGITCILDKEFFFQTYCPKIKFVDGTEEKFDLVVGADGIRSTVRRLIFDSYEPVFSGYRILYAVAPAGNRANPTAVCQRFNEGASWISLSAGGSIPTNDIAAVAIKTKEYRPEQWNNPGTKDEMILEAKKWNINDATSSSSDGI